MRHLKRISFFIYTCLIFAAGFYGHIRFEEAFYPGRPLTGRVSLRMSAEEEGGANEDDTVTVARSFRRITAATALEVRTYDMVTGEERTEVISMPERYIGLDREAFLVCVRDQEAAPLLSEKSAGLVSMEVESFSPEKVVLKKSYRRAGKTEGYYLVLEQNFVVVYEADRKTVWLATAIDGRTLPDEIRSQILRGWELGSESELEKFLVSYSG